MKTPSDATRLRWTIQFASENYDLFEYPEELARCIAEEFGLDSLRGTMTYVGRSLAIADAILEVAENKDEV